MDNLQKNMFMLLLILSQVFAIAMVVLAIVWTKGVLDGFAWDGSSKEFNLHPLIMVCGFVLLHGEGILLFRVFRQHDKRFVKLLHGSFHLLAFVTIVVGLVAVFDFHNTMKFPNMYSLHSWCGLITVLLFCLQFAFGLTTFLFPGFRESIRAFYLPVHKYFGMSILFMCSLSVVSGINEKLFFSYPNGSPNSPYSKLPYGAVIGNCLGIVTVGYVLLVGFLSSNPEWKRVQDEEAEPLSLHFKQVSTHMDTDEE